MLEAMPKANGHPILESPTRAIAYYRVSTESGKRNDRPELEKALGACKRRRAKLIIAKLDRLSRNLAFIATVMDRKIDFVCCDNPHATKFTIHILAAVAEHERDAISARTKAALAAAKARGKRLGDPDIGRRAAERNRALAAARADQLRPIIAPLVAARMPARAIAEHLNARGIVTPAGGRWSLMAAWRTCKRLGI
jgi:DNA invertase Pin-like site-specific DNA recombinase